MGHNGHVINLYGIIMTLMKNVYAGGQSSLGHLSLVHRECEQAKCHYWELQTRESVCLSGMKTPSRGWGGGEIPARWSLQPGL